MKLLLPLLMVVVLLTGCTSNTTTPANTPTQSASHFAIPSTDDGLPGSGPIRRYDWFSKLWIERRSHWATQVQADQGALVFLGDSITQGWGDTLGGNFSGVKVANRGISGDTSRGLLIRLQEDVLSLHPSGIVLLIGTNDIEEAATPWIVASNLRLLLVELKKHNPAMPVIVCEVMPSSPEKQRPAYLIRRLNQLISEVCADQPQVTVLETWKLFAGPTNDAKPEEFPDLLHPNAAGYAKWASALRPLLATLGFLNRTPDEFTIENDFVSLFNGRDLTGWGYLPSTPDDAASARSWQASSPNAASWPMVKEAVSFDGLTASPDGRYVAQNGRMIVTTPVGGRRVQKIWTKQEFPKNFILRLQFRATPNTDSGIYLRGPQLQCRDYLIAGPYTQLKNYRAGEWNDIEVTVQDNIARATCNGEVLEEAMKLPATGPLGLEGDNGQMEYRRIRLQELP